MAMRDPVLYRIRRVPHQRTGDDWLIYPTYDWAHGQSDAIEGVTHSICTLEFADHRPLYDWCLSHLDLPHEQPEQTEFARLNLTHTVMSKRLLKSLVDEGVVDGWDDPRMPTLRGMRRRGYPAEAIRAFVDHISVAKTNSVVEIELLESFVRRQHNAEALRRMAVLDPVKVVITNWPDRRARRARGEGGRGGQQPRGRSGRDPPGALQRRAVDRARRLHGRPAAEVLPAHARARGAPAGRLLHHRHRARSPTTTAPSSRSAPPTTPRPRAARPPTAAR